MSPRPILGSPLLSLHSVFLRLRKGTVQAKSDWTVLETQELDTIEIMRSPELHLKSGVTVSDASRGCGSATRN